MDMNNKDQYQTLYEILKKIALVIGITGTTGLLLIILTAQITNLVYKYKYTITTETKIYETDNFEYYDTKSPFKECIKIIRDENPFWIPLPICPPFLIEENK